MSEKQEAIFLNQEIGCFFYYSEERETRTPNHNSKYADKVTRKAKLTGHTDTFKEASEMLKTAKEKVEKVVTDK